ncbi:MAG: Do family serine endopeptidase [Burkholderiaceae bacterium]|nr:MAG: Do family serine endopeptidase [Burkholderiaceae bacterium]
MLRKLWLIFAQTATVCVAILFIVSTLKPEWLGPARAQLGLLQASPGLPAITVGRASAISSYNDAVKKAMPAVVNIFTSKEVRVPNNPFQNDPLFRHFFGDRFGSRKEQVSSLGSGVIVSADGYVLTNNHVVDSADEIEIALSDGRKASAKLVGGDPETDIALLKIDLTNLPVIAFGNSDQANVGDVVLAIGNPFGVGQTVTMGIVSATGRTHLGINTFENFIQTDAAINPGNSGGALVDSNGNLIGINSAIFSRSGGSLGIGFAIPSATAKQIMDALASGGQVVRGYIGVEPQDVTPELAEAFKLSRKNGAIVTGLQRGGPADKAGLKVGDILIAVEGKAVDDTTAMLNLVAQLVPGNKARLKILRDNKEMEVDVTVGKRPQAVRE